MWSGLQWCLPAILARGSQVLRQSVWATQHPAISDPPPCKGVSSSQTTGLEGGLCQSKMYKHAGKHSGQEKSITVAETDRSNGPTLVELATLPQEAPGSRGAVNQPLSTRAANTAPFPSVHYGKFSRDTTTEMYLYQPLWNEYGGNKLRRVSFWKKGLFCGIKVKITAGCG